MKVKLNLTATDFGRLCFGERVTVNVPVTSMAYKALKKAFESGNDICVEVMNSNGAGNAVAVLPCYVDRATDSFSRDSKYEVFIIESVDGEIN